MSITLSDGIYAAGGLTVSPQLLSGSIEFVEGQYLQLSTASTQFNLVGDFTIEAWVYPTELLTDYWGIFDARVNGASDIPWKIGLKENSSRYIISWSDTNEYLGTATVPLNAWSHVAVVRSGDTLTLYLNGNVDAVNSPYTTYPIDPGTTQPVIGTKDQIAGAYGTVGNISNLRIVNGIAVYTTAFTPSSSPLTAVQPANFNGSPSEFIYTGATVLLLNTTNNDFNFVDGSDNHFSLTGPNMPTTSALSPFFGSLLFNGTSDYLIVNNTPNPIFAFGTGDFTVEAWINLTYNTIGFISQIVGGHNYGSGADWLFGISTSGQLVFYGTNGAAYITATSEIPLDTWIHVAFSMISGTGTIYINGVASGSGNLNGPYGPSLGNYIPITIGDDATANPASAFNGYISNLRIVKGVGVYTTKFIPPTTQLTSVQGPNVNGVPSAAITGIQTSLLLNTQYNNGTYLLDSSNYHQNVSSVLMPVPSATNPFGISGSLSFNGSSDYLTVVDSGASPEFTFGDGDFTIECWIYTTASGVNQGIISKIYNIGISAGAFLLYINPSNIPTLLSCDNEGGSGWTIGIGITTVATNTWNHIAATRNGNVFTIWVNGVLSDTVTSSFTLSDNPVVPVAIGSADSLGNPSYLFHGNISNMRVVKGISVYNSNFVPSMNPLASTQSIDVNGNPSAAITGTETSLLLNTLNNTDTYLYDTSSYQFIVLGPNMPVPDASTPLASGGSASFNGTSSVLTIASATELGFGTGDYTIEFWVNFTAISDIVCFYNTNYGNFFFQYNPGGAFQTGVAGYAVVTSFGFTPDTDTWYHVAVTRSSSITQCWVNGTQIDSPQTDSVDYGQSGASVGGGGPGSQVLNGYLSNFRVVKGIAVYTTDFTPSTTPLTATQSADVNGSPSAAITGSETSLLLNTPNSVLNRIDSSSYNLFVSSPNTPLPNSFVPNFLIEGSAFFNGTSSYLTIASNAALTLGTGDFTIEAWINPTSVDAGPNQFNIATIGDLQFYVSGGTLYFYDATQNAGGGTVVINQWQHVAVTRSGTSVTCYIDGVQCISTTSSVNFVSATTLIGTNQESGGTRAWGYISNFRIVKGVAVYTTDFTPSTTPLTSIQSANVNGNPSAAITGTETSLLLNTFNSSNNRLDSSSYNFLVTSPNTPVPDDLNPLLISEGSMLFNGTSDYLTVASDPVLAFSTGDFTVECWVNWTALTTSAIFDNQTAGGFNLYYDAGTYLSNYLVVSNRYVNQIAYSWTPAIDTWYHIAISRSGTDLRMFIDGTLVTTTTGDTTDYQAGDYNIGSDQGGGPWYLNGNLSNLRVVKGLAVYTSNFVLPTSNLTTTQLTNQNGLPSAAIPGTETSLLLNTPNNVLNIFDSSSYHLQVTSPNTPTSVINNPF